MINDRHAVLDYVSKNKASLAKDMRIELGFVPSGALSYLKKKGLLKSGGKGGRYNTTWTITIAGRQALETPEDHFHISNAKQSKAKAVSAVTPVEPNLNLSGNAETLVNAITPLLQENNELRQALTRIMEVAGKLLGDQHESSSNPNSDKE